MGLNVLVLDKYMIKMPIKGGSHGFMEKSQGMELKNNTGASQLQHNIPTINESPVE